ncbi:hypothetical protein FRB90_006449, partial [Tulasnella sp. 427]
IDEGQSSLTAQLAQQSAAAAAKAGEEEDDDEVPALEAVEDDEEVVDETGLDQKDLEMIISQVRPGVITTAQKPSVHSGRAMETSSVPVCRTLNELVSTTSTLTYRCTLWKYGYADFPTTEPLSIIERQAHVQRLGQGWMDPQWSEMTSVPLTREGTTYELQGGIFVSGRPSTEDDRATRGLLFWELPWRNPTEQGHPVAMTGLNDQPTWTIRDLGVDVNDFQIDPDQDLLILVSKRKTNTGDSANVVTVHIRNMSDGVKHPESEVPLKHLELHQTPGGHRFVVIGFIIQIVDDICIEDDGIDSVVFLDEETIMLVRRAGDIIPKTMSLDVYKYSLSTTVRPPTSRTSEYPLPPLGAKQTARFSLPRMPDEPGVITHVIARCEPTPSYRKTPTRRPRQMQSPPPTARPTQGARLVSLSFVTVQPQLPPLERPFIFLFLADKIRELANAYGSKTFSQRQWESWGPENTRILERSAPSQWICYTYGSRFAFLNRVLGRAVVTILDFNPRNVRSGEDVTTNILSGGAVWKRWETENNIGVYSSVPGDVAALGSWTRDTFSSLPYIRYESTTSFANATSVMIDHERVIVATREFFGDEFLIFNV